MKMRKHIFREKYLPKHSTLACGQKRKLASKETLGQQRKLWCFCRLWQ